MGDRFYRGKGDYAGRLDTLAECHGEYQGIKFAGVYVFDYKSSKDPKKFHPKGYIEWRLQTSAYRHGVQETRQIDVDGNATIRLDKFSGLPDVFDQSPTYIQDLVSFKRLTQAYHSMYPEKLVKGVPSVTTILGMLNKPALVQWAANTTADYISQRFHSSPNDNNAFAGLVSASDLEEWLVDAKKNWRKLKQDAADIGTEVHKLVEAFLKDGTMPHLPTLDSRTENAFKAFLEFYESVEMRVIEQEINIRGTF